MSKVFRRGTVHIETREVIKNGTMSILIWNFVPRENEKQSQASGVFLLLKKNPIKIPKYWSDMLWLNHLTLLGTKIFHWGQAPLVHKNIKLRVSSLLTNIPAKVHHFHACHEWDKPTTSVLDCFGTLSFEASWVKGLKKPVCLIVGTWGLRRCAGWSVLPLLCEWLPRQTCCPGVFPWSRREPVALQHRSDRMRRHNRVGGARADLPASRCRWGGVAAFGWGLGNLQYWSWRHLRSVRVSHTPASTYMEQRKILQNLKYSSAAHKITLYGSF